MVTKEMRETIIATVDETFRKMESISWLDRQKKLSDEVFKNTERILYSLDILKEHIANEKEYLEMAFRDKSASIVRFSKNKTEAVDDDVKLHDRKASYQRSVNDVERVTKALEHIKNKKGYEVIELRYLTYKEGDSRYTFEEIAERLSGSGDYSESLNEKTVRNYKNKLIKEMAIYLFGSDAV